MYYLTIQGLNVSNNNFMKEADIIQIDSFTDTNNAQIKLIDSTFKNNVFQAGGGLI